MREAFSDGRAAVFDDWLEPDAFEAAAGWLEGFRWFSVESTGKRGAGGTLDELAPAALAGRLKLLGGAFVVDRAASWVRTEKTLYPSGGPLDLVLESVRGRESALEPWLGRRGRDWQLLGAGPRAYPPGRGLGWHDDARFRGTFVLYLHRRWDEAWDGRLAFEDARGLGRYVSPRPNRCVFLRAGTPHAVLPVSPARGAAPRLSVIGYAFAPKSSSKKP